MSCPPRCRRHRVTGNWHAPPSAVLPYDELDPLGAVAPPLMSGHGCVLVGAGDELVPDDELALDEGLAAVDDDDVVRAIVAPVAAAPPEAASATPVAPAPIPAATMPVMISRRVRPPILEAIWFLPSRQPLHGAVGSSRSSAWPSGLPAAGGRALSGL